jgi:hypothetical protein
MRARVAELGGSLSIDSSPGCGTRVAIHVPLPAQAHVPIVRRRLRLAGAYGALPLAERRSLAERWLERARELGYERLELVDQAGRLLARPARVGSGMILLDAVSTPP